MELNEKGVSNTLTSVQKDNVVIQINPSKESGGKQPYQHNRVYSDRGAMPTLDTESSRKSILNNGNIRRLTEIECERLQGFPDNWTKYGIYERQVWINKKKRTFKIVEGVEKVPRTQRYKMLGNAVTVDAVEAIAKRIKIK